MTGGYRRTLIVVKTIKWRWSCQWWFYWVYITCYINFPSQTVKTTSYIGRTPTISASNDSMVSY